MLKLKREDLIDGMIILSEPSGYSAGSIVEISNETTSRKQTK